MGDAENDGLGEFISADRCKQRQIGEGDSNWQVGGHRTLDARASTESGPRTEQDVFK